MSLLRLYSFRVYKHWFGASVQIHNGITPLFSRSADRLVVISWSGSPLNWRVSRHLNIYTRVATRKINAVGSLRAKVGGQLHAGKEVSEHDKRELPATWKSPALVFQEDNFFPRTNDNQCVLSYSNCSNVWNVLNHYVVISWSSCYVLQLKDRLCILICFLVL